MNLMNFKKIAAFLSLVFLLLFPAAAAWAGMQVTARQLVAEIVDAGGGKKAVKLTVTYDVTTDAGLSKLYLDKKDLQTGELRRLAEVEPQRLGAGQTYEYTDRDVEVGKNYEYIVKRTLTDLRVALTVTAESEGRTRTSGHTTGDILTQAIGYLFLKVAELINDLTGLRDIEHWVFGVGPAAGDLYHVVPPIRWPAVQLARTTLAGAAWLVLGLAMPLVGLRLMYGSLDPAQRYGMLDVLKGLLIFTVVVGFGLTFFGLAADVLYSVLRDLHSLFGFRGDIVRTLAAAFAGGSIGVQAGGYLGAGLATLALAIVSLWLNVIYIVRQVTLCVCLATMPLFAFFAVFPFTRGIFVHYVRHTLATLMVPLFHAVMLGLFLGTFKGGGSADVVEQIGGPVQAIVVLFAMIPLASLPHMLLGAGGGGTASVAGMAVAAGTWRLIRSGIAGGRAVAAASAAGGVGLAAAAEGEPLMKKLAAAAKTGGPPLFTWADRAGGGLTGVATRVQDAVQDLRLTAAETLRAHLPAPLARTGLAERATGLIAGTEASYRQAITATAQELREIDQAVTTRQAAFKQANLRHQVAATELRRVEADLRAQALAQGIPANRLDQWVRAQNAYRDAQTRAAGTLQARDAYLGELRRTELARAEKLTVYENMVRDYAQYAPERAAAWAPPEWARPAGGLKNRIGYRYRH